MKVRSLPNSLLTRFASIPFIQSRTLSQGSNHHEVFRRTASVVLSIFAHQSLPHRIAREPEATRGTSRTRTRGPDRSFNDDLVDIQVPAPASFHLQEGLGVDAGLLEDCTQRSLRHVAGVVGDGGVAVERRIEPDLMRTRCLSVEHQAETLQRLVISR